MPVVEASGLEAGYLGEKPVFSGVDLSVEDGELLLLLGSTGAGKSTLLLGLAGAVPRLVPGYLRGRLRVAGLDPRLEGLAAMSRHLGLLLQDPEAQTVMFKVYEEVYFPLENLRCPPGEIPRLARETLRRVGLEKLWDSEVDTLSTGLKQRLALAAVLAPRPRLLLLDEPTAHIDPASAAEIYRVVADEKKGGASAIVVDHRVEYVEQHADRVLFMSGGELAEAPSLDALAERVGLDTILGSGVWVPPRLLSPRKVRPPPRWTGEGDVLVEASSLSLRLGGRRVLRDVSLRVRRGEIAVILGPNGAGKTSLLRVLAGVQDGWEGSVTVDGGPPAPSRAVYVTQIPEHQFVARTVLGEVEATYRILGYPPPEARRAAEELLERHGLGGLAGRSLYRLSQGQKRLVSLAAVEPLNRQVYLLDEPTFGLDMRYSLLVAREIEGLAARGKAVIVVTHDSWLPAILECRVYGLSGGRIVYEGGFAELLEEREAWPPLSFRPPPMLDEGGADALPEYRARIRGVMP